MTETPIPASADAERGLLSCLLFKPRLVARVADRLTVEQFFSDQHCLIYGAILALYQRGRAGTVKNVADELERRGKVRDVIGPQSDSPQRDLLSLLNGYACSLDTLTDLDDYLAIVQRTALMRALIGVARITAQAAYDQDENAFEIAEQALFAAGKGMVRGEAAPLVEVTTRYMQAFEQRVRDRAEGLAYGVPTGLRPLDELWGGLQPATLTVLAARPAIGKTSLALTIATSIVSQSRRCFFASVEMSEGELCQRLLAQDVPIDQSYLRDGDVSPADVFRVRAAAARLADLDLLIDDQSYQIDAIVSTIRRAHQQKPLHLAVVDYLQLVELSTKRGKNEMRTEEVGEIAKRLRRLAKELAIPILVLAQLNRDVEGRESPRPRLSDLAESGRIEQHSDLIAFLYADKEQVAKKEQCDPYRVHVYTAKHRNGREGDVELWFRPRITRFQVEEPGYGEQSSA